MLACPIATEMVPSPVPAARTAMVCVPTDRLTPTVKLHEEPVPVDPGQLLMIGVFTSETPSLVMSISRFASSPELLSAATHPVMMTFCPAAIVTGVDAKTVSVPVNVTSDALATSAVETRVAGPVAPVAPALPVGPVAPVAPAPVAPVAPAGPVGPDGPAGPVAPVWPTAPTAEATWVA